MNDGPHADGMLERRESQRIKHLYTRQVSVNNGRFLEEITALSASPVYADDEWVLEQLSKCPRQESNLDLNLRRVACQSSTPRGRK